MVVAGLAQRPRLFASALVFVQLRPASSALRGLSRCALTPAFSPVHVRPIKANENEENTMTTIEFTLLIDALARFVAVLATFVIALRRHRR
jgi:hypothetical protein